MHSACVLLNLHVKSIEKRSGNYNSLFKMFFLKL